MLRVKQQGMLTLALFSYVLEICDDACTTLSQNLVDCLTLFSANTEVGEITLKCSL